jgi:LPS-assembly lipoprotein
MRLLNLLLLALTLIAGACGFHLRGMGQPVPLAFSSLTVAGSAPLLAEVLNQQLALRGDLTLNPPVEAEAVLMLEGEAVDRQILTVNRSGRVTEYAIVYRVRFSLRQGAATRIDRAELALKRDYSFDPNNVLGKEAEEQLLIRELRSDAAQQIQRRLAALKPIAGQSVASAQP